jgi:vacuolar protein 8
VGDYSIFLQHWEKPDGGLHGYLHRFLASGDPTFQHIAIWTLLQLLESGDERLGDSIAKAEEIVQMIKTIADKAVESDDEENEDGEGEVVSLARRSLELLERQAVLMDQRKSEGDSKYQNETVKNQDEAVKYRVE